MSRHFFAVGRSPRLVRVTAAVGLLVVTTAGLALADTSQSASGGGRTDAVAPVEEFSRQLDELKKTFGDLNKRIDSGAKTIDNATDPVASRKQLDDLRAIVSALLGSVADNGEVAQLGAKALEHAHAKEKSLREDTRFTPEQRDFLLRQWEKLARDTQTATAELDAARAHFAKVLRTLQTNDDYIDELMEIRQGDEALKVVRDLAKQIHEASDMLTNFINSLTPPQPGL
jgi:chromosome segregation ATPase